jgi:hypothetical protein
MRIIKLYNVYNVYVQLDDPQDVSIGNMVDEIGDEWTNFHTIKWLKKFKKTMHRELNN